MTVPIAVLIVDDHGMVAEAIGRVLAREPDLSVAGSAGSVAAADYVASQCKVDVVVMDYRLPDGTGVDAMAKVKAHHPDAHVLLFSGSDASLAVREAVAAGCSGFVAKDEPLDVLVSAIRAAASGRTFFTQGALRDLMQQQQAPRSAETYGVTSRELEVLAKLAAGKSTDEIVAELYLSPHTVRNHIRNVMTKLDAHSRLEAVAVAVREGLISFDGSA